MPELCCYPPESESLEPATLQTQLGAMSGSPRRTSAIRLMSHDTRDSGASVVLLAGIFAVSSLPLTVGFKEQWMFPFPVLNDVIVDLSDVIMRPTKATVLSINATLFDLDTNTTLCDLSSSMETDYRLTDRDGDCNVKRIDKGYTLITATDTSVFINLSGSKSRIPSIHALGERYIFPWDFDKHQSGRTKSLLIYPSVKNTTVRVCFDRFDHFGGSERLGDSPARHFSAKFMSRLQNSIDGTFMCYRANLARDEIWMINNVSVPGGVEVSANNPVGLLRVHLANTSHSSENGQFTADPEPQGQPLIWDIYPPLTFWGRQFIVFPRQGSELQNIIVIAEAVTVLTINASGIITTLTIPGRKAEQVSFTFSRHVTITATNQIILYTVSCAENASREGDTTYYAALDSTGYYFNDTLHEHEYGIHIVCNEPMEAWSINGANSTKLDPNFTGEAYIGNSTVYFASFPKADMNSGVYVNLTKDHCFLQKSLNSGGCGLETNITTSTNKIIKNTSRSMDSDKSHPRIVSKDDMSDSSSGGVIGAHIAGLDRKGRNFSLSQAEVTPLSFETDDTYHNVNKSGGENLSDTGLNGNKTENIGNGSDVQIAANQTKNSYLSAMTETPESSTKATLTTNISVDFNTSQSEKPLLSYTLAKLFGQGRTTTEPLTERLKKVLNIPNITESYRNAATSMSNISPILIPTADKKSTSGNGTEIDGNGGLDRLNDGRQNKSRGRPDSLVNGSKWPNGTFDTGDRTNNATHVSGMIAFNLTSGIDGNITNSENSVDSIEYKQTQNHSLTHGDKRVKSLTEAVSFQDSEENTNISSDSFRNDTKHSKTSGNESNDPNRRFKVVLDILSSGNKNTDINTRLLRYERKNPSYIHQNDDGSKLERVGDGKSLVAVILSLSSAVLAVIAIILVFFFIEFFSRRKQHRTTRIRPFLSDF